MPPEQCEGREADARSDLYAVGCMMYFMLSGTPPYSGDSHVAVMMQHMRAPIPRLDPASENPIDEFLGGLLAKDPTQRFASAEDALNELTKLEELQATLPTRAQKLSSRLDSARHRMRYQYLLLPLFAISAVLLPVTVIYNLRNAPFDTGPPLTETPSQSLLHEKCLAMSRSLNAHEDSTDANFQQKLHDELGPELKKVFEESSRVRDLTDAAHSASLLSRLPQTSRTLREEWEKVANANAQAAIAEREKSEKMDDAYDMAIDLRFFD